MLNKKSVDDINVKGKRVLVRCDFNVPLQDGKITDENRLVAALPTIKKLIADGGKVILCSHLGKPKGEPKPELSLAPVAVRLSELLGQEVKFAADPEVVGPNAKAAVAEMKDGDVILLENTRYRAEETKNEDAFSKDLASLCDVFYIGGTKCGALFGEAVVITNEALGRDFRYRFQQDNENNTIKASVYSRICYEKASDVREETFPWDEEGIARMRQWLQENYEAFCRREGIPEAAE